MRSIFSVKDLRTKIVFTLLMVVVYKALSVIPVPGVNTEALGTLVSSQAGLSFFSAITWWGLSNFSIILMGLSPYINAMIIIQLLGVIIPAIENMRKEGEAGQRKITKMTRWLTLPLAFAQSYWMILLLNTLAGGTIIDTSNTGLVLMAMSIVTAWTMFLLWLWETMTEYGISNGISIIISASVLSGVPSIIASYFPWTWSINNTFSSIFLDAFSNTWWIGWLSSGLSFLIMTALTVLVIYVIIKFTQGYRKIPVIYTRTGREEKSYFPIKVNQAGMIPIIFSVSLVTFPSILGEVLSNSNAQTARTIGEFFATHFSFNNPSWLYIFIYFALIVLFSYFYVSITFRTEDIAESIQKRGWYIPWVRPGQETAEYLSKVSSHLTLFGWTFLALVAIFPYVMLKFTWQQIDFLVTGAGLIIIVSVILDLVSKVDSEMQLYDYSKFK